MVAVEKETVSQGKSGWLVPIGKYLIFLLGKEDYGVSILRVREIVKVIPFRSLPRAPSHIKGVVNLRGAHSGGGHQAQVRHDGIGIYEADQPEAISG